MSAAAWKREILGAARLAAPVIAVQVGLMAMGVVDNMMVGHLSQDALAAANLGHNYLNGVLFAVAGVLLGLDPLVAQAWGAGDGRSAAAHVERGIVLSLVLSLPATALVLDSAPALRLLGQDPDIVPGASLYARIVGFSNPAFFVFFAIRQALQAVDRLRPLVIAIVAANLLNVVLDWGLVFGKLGLPALGLEGSAIATCISRWLLLVATVLAASRHLRSGWRPLRRETHRLRPYARLIGIGAPIGFMVALELWVFVAVGFLMGSESKTAMAGHAIAINLASLVFMVPLGLGMASAARVGQAIGRGDDAAARRAAVVPLGACLLFQCLTAAVFLGFPDRLARLYTFEADAVALAATLVPIAGFFQIFDGLQVVAAGILRGAADTRVPAALALVGYWVLGLPVGVALVRSGHLGPEGYWWGLCIGLAAVSLLLVLRVRSRFRGHLERAEPEARP